MVVLVTGSSGFIGRHVVRSLHTMGAQPIGFDVIPPDPRWAPDGFKFVRGTMANLEEVLGAIVDHKVQRIIALGYVMAPLMAPDFRDFVGAVKANVLGNTHVFEAARLTGVDRVVFGSTCGVYGSQRQYGDRPITEEDSGRTDSSYSLMKLVNEDLATRYSKVYGLKIVRMRPSGISGHGNTMWVSRMLSPVAVGQEGYVSFRSASRVNIASVRDLGDLYSMVALAPDVKYDVYNATAHACTASGMAEIARQFIPDARITFDESGPLREDSGVCLVDNSRAVTEFGWQPRSLADAILLHLEEAREEAGLEPLRAEMARRV